MFEFKLLSGSSTLPRQTHDSAGYDLFATDDVILNPGQRVVIGLAIESRLPRGWYGSIRDRSGLAAKQGVTVLGGVIDPDYRGEWKVILFNTSGHVVEIKKGIAVAQVIFQSCGSGVMEVQTINDTERGTNGFGSSDREGQELD